MLRQLITVNAVAIWATSSQNFFVFAKSLRGNQVLQLNETGSGKEPLLCRVTTVHTVLAAKTEYASAGTDEHDACIPIFNGEESHLILPMTLDISFRSQYSDLVESGRLVVSIPGASIRDHELDIPANATIDVYKDIPDHLRHLSSLRDLSSTGTMSVLVVRVTTSDGKSPSASLDEIRDQWFGSGVTMSSQYRSCSANKLNFVDGGGIEVRLDSPGSSFTKPSELVDAAVRKVMQAKGVSSLTSLADKVVFCQPGVVGGWLAVAPVNHWRMSFNDEWCSSLSASIHEMGHSIGLLHSGEGESDYGDTSGYMGYGVKSSIEPLKCFNGLKHWQLGWYKDRAVQINSSSATKVNLATFVDYKLTTPDHAVLANIDNKYYLQYNRAKGMNSETGAGVNKVTIVTPVSSGSRLVAQLNPSGPRFVVRDYSRGMDLVVEVCCQRRTRGVDSMILSVGLGRSLCNDTTSLSCNSGESQSSTASNSGTSPTASFSLEAAVYAAACKTRGERCSSDAQCCGDSACLGTTSATRRCRSCLSMLESCSSNNACCGGMKCSNGSCRA